MILHFPSLDTLQLALTSGLAPTEVTLAPAKVRLESAQVWIEPSVPLARGVRPKLRRLGVAVLERKSVTLDETVQCWLQLLPLRKEAGLDAVSPQTPVLFELDDPKQLPELAGEILRLGNDRQSFRGLDDGDEARVYLRVIGPPYYSLLRALEKRDEAHAVQAYVERGPRVWVALGYRHPLLEHLQAPPGKLLLLQPPRTWQQLDEAPFHDIYDIIEFKLPAQPIRCREVELGARLQVPLRLTRSSGAEPAELWTLRERAVEQLDAFVRSAQDRVLARLRFAVAGDTNPTIILMAVRGKAAPPALDFHGQSYRRHQRMDNLFVPVGQRLEPPLRRDAVRKLLAEDPEQVTWLAPGANGSFVPESIPDRAFESLEKWIDYVIERDKQALASWVRSTQFDFEPFVCKDEAEPKKKDKPRRRERDDLDDDEELPPAAPAVEQAAKPKKRSEPKAEEALQLPREEPGQLEIKLGELHTRFLEDPSPLDAPGRREQWRQIALHTTALSREMKDPNRAVEAGLCWLHILWEEQEPERGSLLGWLEAEKTESRRLAPVVKELNRIAASKDPESAEIRYFAAGAACAGLGSLPDAHLLDVARARTFLEKHEGVGILSIRAVWLAWLGLARLAGGDELALARARDRLLERLFQFGLSTEREVPGFLRFSNHRQSEKFRNVRERVLKLRERIQDWVKKQPLVGQSHFSVEKHRTQGYIDLMFAFGLARLGEKNECEKLLERGKDVLNNVDDAHLLLCQGYEYRIQQALDNKQHAGPLPPNLLENIKLLRENQRETSSKYSVEKLRQYSVILDPDESFDPYRNHRHSQDQLEAELAPLADTRDLPELTARIEKLLSSKRKEYQSPQARVQILGSILQVAPRLGQDWCLSLLRRALETLSRLDSTLDPATRKSSTFLLYKLVPLLQHGMSTAAHWGQVDLARQFVGRFLDTAVSLHETGSTKELEDIVRKCFLSLRKLGLREEIERMLQGMADAVLKRESLALARTRLGARWVPSLCTLLHVAAGWLYGGRVEIAMPILDAARDFLTDPHVQQPAVGTQDKVNVACAYLSALGQAPIDRALTRIEELFGFIGNIYDSYLCNNYYSLSKLKVVEAVVLAVASEDFAVGPEVRRWLDDEEYLVRRRIHADVLCLTHGEG